MPPIRHYQSIHTQLAGTGDLANITGLHGGYLPHTYSRLQPYIARVPSQKATTYSVLDLHLTLLDNIKHAQDAAVNITSQKKDANQLRDFLVFCKSLGIPAYNALPAGEDILMAWASSYAGHIAGKTVSAKISAIKKEHEKRGLQWCGGEHLWRIIKGVEELIPLE
jgi:hypothetical protein